MQNTSCNNKKNPLNGTSRENQENSLQKPRTSLNKKRRLMARTLCSHPLKIKLILLQTLIIHTSIKSFLSKSIVRNNILSFAKKATLMQLLKEGKAIDKIIRRGADPNLGLVAALSFTGVLKITRIHNIFSG